MGEIVRIKRNQEDVIERIKKRSVELSVSFKKSSSLNYKEENLKILVTNVGCDDVGSILKKLGYDYTVVSDDDLCNYEKIRDYNILFINCSMGGNPLENKESLKKFVKKGGALYVSDLSSSQISSAFPGYIEFSSGGIGNQRVNATIVDKNLLEIIGPNINIYFDLPFWVPIERVYENVHIYLLGSFKTDFGYKKDKPILVSFKYGAGEVIYTSFHNHKQTTEMEEKLLKFLILKPASIISKTPILELAQSKGLIPINK